MFLLHLKIKKQRLINDNKIKKQFFVVVVFIKYKIINFDDAIK